MKVITLKVGFKIGSTCSDYPVTRMQVVMIRLVLKYTAWLLSLSVLTFSPSLIRLFSTKNNNKHQKICY